LPVLGHGGRGDEDRCQDGEDVVELRILSEDIGDEFSHAIGQFEY